MLARIVLVVVVAAGVTLAARPVEAQIVNVQSALATEAEEGLSGGITGSAHWRTGNTKLLILGLAPVARYRRGKHLVVALLRGDLGSAGDTTIIKKTFEHVRYRYTVSERILAELFGQHEFDEFKRLNIRTLVGAGPRFGLLHTKRIDVALGVAYMLEYQKLDRRDPMLPDAGESSVDHRASTYLTGSFEMDDRVQLIETVYAQPRFDDPSDIRLFNQSQLVMKLTKKVSLNTSFVLGFDSEPPAGIEKLDTTLKSSITFSF